MAAAGARTADGKYVLRTKQELVAVGFTPGQADGVLAARQIVDEASGPSSRVPGSLQPFRPRKPEDAAAYVPGVTRLSPPARIPSSSPPTAIPLVPPRAASPQMLLAIAAGGAAATVAHGSHEASGQAMVAAAAEATDGNATAAEAAAAQAAIHAALASEGKAPRALEATPEGVPLTAAGVLQWADGRSATSTAPSDARFGNGRRWSARRTSVTLILRGFD